MDRFVHTLYSEAKKRIILTVYHCMIDNEYTDESDNLDVVLSVVDGNGKIVLDDGETAVCGGDSFLFASGRRCRIECETPMEVFLIKLNFGDYITGQFSVMNREVIGDFFTTIHTVSEKINGIHINARRIKDVAFMIEDELENLNRGSECVVRAYVSLLISLIVQYYSIDGRMYDTRENTHYKDIEKTLTYINEHLSEKISLDTLACLAAMGKTNYSNVFKKVTGMTVWDYILNARVELAANLLLEKKGDYNITEVAYKCGFNNSAHFNKTFKKLKGKTPSDFKKYPENECF